MDPAYAPRISIALYLQRPEHGGRWVSILVLNTDHYGSVRIHVAAADTAAEAAKPAGELMGTLAAYPESLLDDYLAAYMRGDDPLQLLHAVLASRSK